MPTLDVSDVLASPEFQDTFTVTQTAFVIGAGGTGASTITGPFPAFGVVIPGKSSLARNADGERIVAYIDIYTTYPLTNGLKTDDVSSREADIVTWHGRQFTVMAIDDFTGFGAGWLHASADLIPLNPKS
jgi:hypothetical protein